MCIDGGTITTVRSVKHSFKCEKKSTHTHTHNWYVRCNRNEIHWLYWWLPINVIKQISDLVKRSEICYLRQTKVNDITNGKYYIHTILGVGDCNLHNGLHARPDGTVLNKTAFHKRKYRLYDCRWLRTKVCLYHWDTSRTMQWFLCSVCLGVARSSALYCMVQQWAAWNSLLTLLNCKTREQSFELCPSADWLS